MTAPRFADAPAKPLIPDSLRAECEFDPVLYAREVLRKDVWRRQQDALQLLAELARSTESDEKAAREFGIRSGNGVGKSVVLAIGASWWFDIVRGSGFITSPTQRQNLNLFAYLRGFRRGAAYSLPGELLGTALRASDSWWIKLITARTDVSFQGIHAWDENDGMNRPRMLALVEEASGVGSMMWPAIRGCVTGHGDVLGAIGNPNVAAGEFAAMFRPGSGVRTMTISAMESPNVVAGRDVVPGLVSKRSVDAMIRQYGRDSDVVRVRVFGLPPKNDQTSVMPLSAWEGARRRAELAEEKAQGIPPIRGRLRGGLDLGRSADSCAFVVRDDRRIKSVRKWSGELTIATREAQDWLRENADAVLAIDGSGMGASIADTLVEEFGARVVVVQFGGVPIGEREEDFLTASGSDVRLHRCHDRRTEIWLGARDWIAEAGEIGVEVEPELLEELEADLLAPRAPLTSKGQFRLEQKDVTRKRLGRSPDLGDALALACAADLVEETASAGAETASSGGYFRRKGSGLLVPESARGGFDRTPVGAGAGEGNGWRRHW